MNLVDFQIISKNIQGQNVRFLQAKHNVIYDSNQDAFVGVGGPKWEDVGPLDNLNQDPKIIEGISSREENRILRAILSELVKLKQYKDKNGKDGYYNQRMPELWDRAQKALNYTNSTSQ